MPASLTKHAHTQSKANIPAHAKYSSIDDQIQHRTSVLFSSKMTSSNDTLTSYLIIYIIINSQCLNLFLIN